MAEACAAQADEGAGATTPFVAPPGINKIVVAIHGVGQQFRCDTIRAVASRFGDKSSDPIPLLPLGYFSIAEGSDLRWSVLDTQDDKLQKIGFAEIYWADIPRQLVEMNDTLEETKAWGRTVASRAEKVYRKRVDVDPALGHEEFENAADVIETIVNGIDVVEKLCALADKALPFNGKFEVGALLRDYAGDVQIVTEFPHYRNKILYRFHAALAGMVDAFQTRYKSTPEIYLVAHSEGTVISLLALLQALSSMMVPDPEGRGVAQDGKWVEHVKGFMTLGSPIDKHIGLWPGLFAQFAFKTSVHGDRIDVWPADDPARVVSLAGQIKWRNYFDYGDPIGFRLDEARRKLGEMACGAFEFDDALHDHGYARYWLPGKAHVDYWKDAELFRHFIDTVVSTPAVPETPPPPTSKWRGYIVLSVPYAVSGLFHYAAIVLLIAGLVEMDPAKIIGAMAGALGPALMLCALTVGARAPQLVRHETRWMAVAAVCLLVIAWSPSGLWLPDWTEVLGPRFRYWVAGAAGLMIVAAWLTQSYRPVRGHRLLMWSGVLACVLLARHGIDLHMLTGFLAFLGLWRLAIVVFDLAFVWHRYIRNAVFVRTLRAWQSKRDAQMDPGWGMFQRRTGTPAPAPAPQATTRPERRVAGYDRRRQPRDQQAA